MVFPFGRRFHGARPSTRLHKRFFAELFGTFWLVLGGCGIAVLSAAYPQLGIGFLGVAFAFGLTVLTMAYAVEKRFPSRQPMIVLGHSMGGCISRLLVTDGGGRLWMQIFGKAPEQVPLSPHTRELFTQEFFFRHRPEVGGVIFIAVPFRGSNLASSWFRPPRVELDPGAPGASGGGPRGRGRHRGERGRAETQTAAQLGGR